MFALFAFVATGVLKKKTSRLRLRLPRPMPMPLPMPRGPRRARTKTKTKLKTKNKKQALTGQKKPEVHPEGGTSLVSLIYLILLFDWVTHYI